MKSQITKISDDEWVLTHTLTEQELDELFYGTTCTKMTWDAESGQMVETRVDPTELEWAELQWAPPVSRRLSDIAATVRSWPSFMRTRVGRNQ